MTKNLCYLTLFLWFSTAIIRAEEPLGAAKNFFEKYQALEQKYDPQIIDLYADEAKIENKRIYPDGRTRVTTMDGKKYKGLLRLALPLAKARGDANTYSELKYVEETGRVRITGKRYSELKKYSSPISILIGPEANGDWKIVEELSESQP